MKTQQDKITLATDDFPDLAEFFSRKSPGDSVSGRFEATLDENTEGLVILSIDDIKLDLSVKPSKGKTKSGSDSKGDNAAAAQMFKGRVDEPEEAEPLNEPEV